MATEYFLLSNFGVRYFMTDYENSAVVPASVGAADEITSVLSCDLGSFSKEVKKYRTLNGNGWESIAPLGQSSDDATFECVREGVGNPYVGTDGVTTYQKIKNWFMNSTKNGGETTPKVIVEIVPRGGTPDAFEGTAYYVIPNNWKPGTKDTETGQEYSFTVSPFGPQKPLSVSYNAANDTFSISEAAAPAITGITVSGEATATIGEAKQYTASVAPSGADGRVAWSVTNGTGEAAISGTGVLVGLQAGTVTVKATSVADPSVNGTKSVTVSAG